MRPPALEVIRMVKWWICNEPKKCANVEHEAYKNTTDAAKTASESHSSTPDYPATVTKASNKQAVLAQCMMNGAIVLLGIAIGMPIGFSAILLPQLQASDSSLKTDDDWASWIASVHSIMTPIGSILAGPMMDHLGRRRTLQISVLPMVTGWMLISLAPNLYVLCVGRMFAGFAVGMVPGPSYVLIGEVSEPRLRGVFSSAQSAAYSLGILMVYALGSLLPWRIVAVAAMVLPVSCFIAFFFLPESPVYLVRMKKVDSARKALMKLRGGNCLQANSELHLLVVHHKIDESAEIMENQTCGTFPGPWSALTRPEVFKPFFIILTFCLLQILSGSYIVIFYGVSLIAKSSGGHETDLNSLAIAVMTALVRFVVSIVTSICLLKIGRRRVGMISGVGTALACFSLFTFLQCGKINQKFETIIIGALIMVYVALNTFGIFSLPCMMIGEVLPSRVRGFVSGILLTMINLMIFTTTKLYPYVECVIGPDGLFLIFAIVAIIITIYVYLFLPETKNRPLTQIETYFACGKNYLWMTRDKTLIARKDKVEKSNKC